MIVDPAGFILKHTRLQRPPHTPEIALHLATQIEPIWRQTEEALGQEGTDPPFWAFAWAGGQALARYLLDHPEEVRSLRVLDFAAGSGLVAIAAAKTGAAQVLAADIDPFCEAATALNAKANAVEVAFTGEDLLDTDPPDVDVICAGDVCYEWPLADRVRRWLETAHRRGVRILIGDPGRAYLPREGLMPLARYEIETTREIEDREVRSTGVFTFAGLVAYRTNIEPLGCDTMRKDGKIDYVEMPGGAGLAATKAFYQAAFGWSFTDWGPDYASFNEGLDGGFWTDAEAVGKPLVILYAHDLEAMESKVKAAGGAVVREIFSFPGGRRFHFRDPGGNELAVWSET